MKGRLKQVINFLLYGKPPIPPFSIQTLLATKVGPDDRMMPVRFGRDVKPVTAW